MVASGELQTIQTLITEGLIAGGLMLPNRIWEAHHNGERLLIHDRKLGRDRKGAIVITTRVTESILTSAAIASLRNYIIVGNELASNVELARLRAERLRRASRFGDHYWAVYTIEDLMLVSLGNPYSSSRLVGEIMRAQFGRPFEQSKVCGQCGELNRYGTSNCVRCGALLSVTGEPNRWIHYDDEETVVRKITPEEKRLLAEGQKDDEDGVEETVAARPSTSMATIRHKLTPEELKQLRNGIQRGAASEEDPQLSSNGLLKPD